MTDLNMREFDRRLKRIDRIHKAGGAFEASGAIGRSYYSSLQSRPRRKGWALKPLAILMAAALLYKGAIYGQLGPASYNGRVAELAAGNGMDRVGAWLMQPDTVTVALGQTIRRAIY